MAENTYQRSNENLGDFFKPKLIFQILDFGNKFNELFPFFKKKIEYVQNKLHGRNPRLLLSQALGDSKHKDVPGLRKMVEGNKQLKPLVSATEQVELLIELATDKNILGRAFTPWCPYV